uniref:Uncharacterized protein n=1 Tax=Romanomermis culicivorax TaxID=13658 RepID=A0A915IRE5_ROMCU
MAFNSDSSKNPLPSKSRKLKKVLASKSSTGNLSSSSQTSLKQSITLHQRQIVDFYDKKLITLQQEIIDFYNEKSITLQQQIIDFL